jgi:hypothetical protein
MVEPQDVSYVDVFISSDVMRSEHFCLLGYNAVQSVESQPTFRTNIIFCYLLHADFLFGLFFDAEDGGDMFLRNTD